MRVLTRATFTALSVMLSLAFVSVGHAEPAPAAGSNSADDGPAKRTARPGSAASEIEVELGGVPLGERPAASVSIHRGAAPLSEEAGDEGQDDIDVDLEVELLSGSISCGSANRGSLRGAVEMPLRGRGFQMPEPWWNRGHRYGTDTLVDLIVRVAAVVDAEYPGSVLGVADLSKETGGALPRHRSHQSGRDVDLLFYALDPDGGVLLPDGHMPYFLRTGRATYAKAPEWSRSIPERYFDLARNWSLVKALITDDETTVEAIFVSRRIRRWLLDYARAVEEPDELLDRAAVVLSRSAGRTHNDHMHVRIGCSERDVQLGRCRSRLASPRKGKRKYHSRVRCPARQREVPTPAIVAPATSAPDEISREPDSEFDAPVADDDWSGPALGD